LIESETRADLEDFVAQTQSPALPSLEQIVRSGNSLVTYEEWQAFKPGGARPDTLHPFSWAREFPDEMARGGFDVIVGNPPYTRIQVMQCYFPDEVDFYQSKGSPYATAERDNFDKYALFVERSLALLNEEGCLGVIIPHKFMSTVSGRALRSLLADDQLVEEVIHFGAQQVFVGVANYTCVLLANRSGQDEFVLERVTDVERWRYGTTGVQTTLPAKTLSSEPWEIAEPAAMAAFERMRSLHPARLGTEADIFVGLQTSADKIYVLHALSETDTHIRVRALDQDWQIEKGILRPFLQDASLTPFERSPANRWIIFPYEQAPGRLRLVQPDKLQRDCPGCWAYLVAHRDALERRKVSGGLAQEQQWYQFGRSQSLGKFDADKLIVQVLSREPRYAFDDTSSMFTGGGNGPYYGLRPKEGSTFSLLYILSVLCHPLSEAMIRTRTSVFRGGYYSHGKQFLERLPIPNPSEADRRAIEDLANDLLNAREILDTVRLPAVRAEQERDIADLTHRLKNAVTKAFGLSADEMIAVEAVPIPN